MAHLARLSKEAWTAQPSPSCAFPDLVPPQSKLSAKNLKLSLEHIVDVVTILGHGPSLLFVSSSFWPQLSWSLSWFAPWVDACMSSVPDSA